MEANFWEKEYNEFFPNVVFKIQKMSSLDVLDLADRNIGKDGDSKQFKLDCLKKFLWTKDGSNWFPILDENGNCTLDGLPYPTLLDLFFEFRKVVCLPVFTESKAYQELLNQTEQLKKAEKHNKSK